VYIFQLDVDLKAGEILYVNSSCYLVEYSAKTQRYFRETYEVWELENMGFNLSEEAPESDLTNPKRFIC
jgi:hypothetical protein